MEERKEAGKKMKVPKMPQVRITISFPPELYQILEEIAEEKKVSYAWVVREAVEGYVERWPREQQERQDHKEAKLRVEKLIETIHGDRARRSREQR